jgi:hypothetical protein
VKVEIRDQMSEKESVDETRDYLSMCVWKVQVIVAVISAGAKNDCRPLDH